MTAVVVDASLAVKWVQMEPLSLEARWLLADWQSHRIARLAPEFFFTEIASALLRARRRSSFSSIDADLALATLEASVIPLPTGVPLQRRAYDIADSLGQWKAYDSLYLALAEREDCDLWTGDERFWNAARTRFPRVRWVGGVTIP